MAALASVLTGLLVAGLPASTAGASGTPSGCAPLSPTLSGCTTVTLSFTGGIQQFTVPDGVGQLGVLATGGNGGGEGNGFQGGAWGQVGGVITVTPGEVLSVLVGGVGANGTASGGDGAGGYGGGGPGGDGAGGGGGASVVSDGATVEFVAGGGGGAGWWGPDAGDGGGDPAGQSGNPAAPSGLNGGPWDPSTEPGEAGPGLGGSQSAGGGGGATSKFDVGVCVSAATATPGAPGGGPAGGSTPGTGGAGGSYPMDASCTYTNGTVTCTVTCGGGGGGGGGYYGGGGAGGGEGTQGGGGGSSYISSAATDIGAPILGGPSLDGSGNGSVRFSYSPCSDPSAGAGTGLVGNHGQTTSSTCPLTVLVTAARTADQKTGLHYDSDKGSPEFYGSGSERSAEAGSPFDHECGSGCMNVSVQVTNPNNNGAAVTDATVKLEYAELPQGTTYPYPRGSGFNGQICSLDVVDSTGVTNDQVSCGTTATEQTDALGYAFFRYWPPGTVSDATATLTATATASGSQCGCSGSGKGHGPGIVRLIPNIVFKAHADLPHKLVKDIARWDDAKQRIAFINAFSLPVSQVFPELAPAFQTLSNWDEARDLGLIAWFLHAFGLTPKGLIDTTLKTWKTGLVTGDGFEPNFIDVLKRFSAYLRISSDLASGKNALYMRLFLSEQSYCDSLHCGADASDFVLFSLEAAKNKAGLSKHAKFDESPNNSVSYLARNWMRGQYGK